jgi:hypothetical protein
MEGGDDMRATAQLLPQSEVMSERVNFGAPEESSAMAVAEKIRKTADRIEQREVTSKGAARDLAAALYLLLEIQSRGAHGD